MELRRAARAGKTGSLVLHGAILLALIAASQLRVDALGDPAIRPPRMIGIVPLAAAAAGPPPSGGDLPSQRQEARGEEPRETREKVQPRVPPEEVPESSAANGPVDAGDQSGIESGVAGGKPGGIEGGNPDGVVGGDPHGISGAPAGGVEPAPAEALVDEPLRPGGEVRPPERTVFVKPEYPEMARRAREQGKVILEIVVGRTGEVEDVVVLRSHPLFDRTAVDAVRQWKYRPALQGGRAVRVYMTVIVAFSLD